MTSKHKEIARRKFLTMSTQNAAGIFALTTLASCTTSEEFTTDENPIIGDNENRQIVTSYELDPAWPQKPEEITWGAVPGVVVDMYDRVWMLNRSIPVVQVYDADGKFITSWAGDQNVMNSSQFSNILVFITTGLQCDVNQPRFPILAGEGFCPRYVCSDDVVGLLRRFLWWLLGSWFLVFRFMLFVVVMICN